MMGLFRVKISNSREWDLADRKYRIVTSESGKFYPQEQCYEGGPWLYPCYGDIDPFDTIEACEGWIISRKNYKRFEPQIIKVFE